MGLKSLGRPASFKVRKTTTIFLVIFLCQAFIAWYSINGPFECTQVLRISLFIHVFVLLGFMFHIAHVYEDELFVKYSAIGNQGNKPRLGYKYNAWLPPMIENGDWKKWLIALFVFFSTEAFLIILGENIEIQQVNWQIRVSEFLYIFFAIALIGELWFRGIWFWASGDNFIYSVLGGAGLFSLLHLPIGWFAVSIALGLGFVYGCARWRGASVLSLALIHAFFGWQHQNFLQTEYSDYVIDNLGFILLLGYGLIGYLILIIFKPDPRVSETIYHSEDTS